MRRLAFYPRSEIRLCRSTDCGTDYDIEYGTGCNTGLNATPAELDPSAPPRRTLAQHAEPGYRDGERLFSAIR